jgi:hypothetical protein
MRMRPLLRLPLLMLAGLRQGLACVVVPCAGVVLLSVSWTGLPAWRAVSAQGRRGKLRGRKSNPGRPPGPAYRARSARPSPRAAVRSQYERRWIIDIKRFQTKTHVLRYAGRYARKPPIAQHRFRHADREWVRFETKDTRSKQLLETAYQTPEFLARLADHLPDCRRHNVRYFGLLSPRAKAKLYRAVFASLKQRQRARPQRPSWASSIRQTFGVDPLIDARGARLRWVRRLTPGHAQLDYGPQ